MPPVVIAAGISAVGAIGGGLLASSAQKKAAGKAADTSLEVAEKNNALQQQIYNSNYAVLNPYAQRGNEAGNAINSLLGIAGTLPAQNQQTGGTGALPVQPEAYNGGNLPGPFGAQRLDGWRRMIENGQLSISEVPSHIRQLLTGQQAQTQQQTPPATTPPINNANPQANYQNAFQNYLNSTGYQFQVDQGNKQITQGYAGRGSLQSGAALKALQTYGQNTATGFFKDYLGLLSNQQGVGLSGASAIAGVGQNFANSVSANNNAAGTSAANAYLAQGNANANLWGTVGGAIGGIANAWGSSYRPNG